MQPAEFKAVPFDESWINHDKIDVHAIYRRPILDEMGEHALDERGVPKWDLTGGLPVHRHYDWVRKGFQYVTLADEKSLKDLAPRLRAKGLNPTDYVMLRNRLVGQSPWNPRLYLQTQPQVDHAREQRLRELVERLGSDVVREVKRTEDPTFELPAHLRSIEPGGTASDSSPSIDVGLDEDDADNRRTSDDDADPPVPAVGDRFGDAAREDGIVMGRRSSK